MLSNHVDNEMTQKIIGAFYTVYNALGFGYLEKVYENALKHELTKQGLKVESQKPIRVFYDDEIVGEYFADLLVENNVLIELKSSSTLTIEHETQLFNYLKATNIEIGLLFNFGPRPEVKRKIWTIGKNSPCQSVQSSKSV